MKSSERGRAAGIGPYKLAGVIAIVASGAVSSVILGSVMPAIGDVIISMATVLTGAS